MVGVSIDEDSENARSNDGLLKKAWRAWTHADLSDYLDAERKRKEAERKAEAAKKQDNTR